MDMLAWRGHIMKVGKLFRMIAHPKIKWKRYLCNNLQNKGKNLTHVFILVKIGM